VDHWSTGPMIVAIIFQLLGVTSRGIGARYVIDTKRGKIGGDYFSAQKSWHKKCISQDNKILQEKCCL